MVPMTGIAEVFLLDAQRSYEKELRARIVADDFAASLTAWFNPDFFKSGEREIIAERILSRTGAQRSYKDAAALGYLLASTGIQISLGDPAKLALDWVSSRPAFVEGAPTAIATDGGALLGVAIGSRKLADEPVAGKLKAWVAGFSGKTLALPGLSVWHKAALQIATSLLSHDDGAKSLRGFPPDLYIALQAHGVVPPLKDDEAKKAEEAVLALLKDEDPLTLESGALAVRVAAFSWITRTTKLSRPDKMQIQDVINLLSKLERSFQRWTWEPTTRKRGSTPQKWRIENEYHVQNLLWFLLAPIFSDLKDEEYLKSTGQLQSRTDLCIPSLRLIIEVKYMYPSSTPQKVIEEIASDASLYLKPGGEFSTILAVIWDEAARVEEHATLQKGLRELPGVIDAVILSRPSLMRE